MEVRFLNGGYCRQLRALVDRRTFRWVKFHAVFLAVRHPREGWVLIDTGYGGRFKTATRSWPYRLYRWATPANMAGTTGESLRQAGIDPAEIRHVVVTHFHADHIGGLAEFPEATIHYHADGWQLPARLSPYRQVRAAFLPALVPDWLADRSQVVTAEGLTPSNELPFPVHDLFGDGLVTLVSLPGHAAGHLGIFLRTEPEPLFYVTDAFWDRAQIDSSLDLIGPVLRLQWDPEAYTHTIHLLRQVVRSCRCRLLACHAPETQLLITAPRGES